MPAYRRASFIQECSVGAVSYKGTNILVIINKGEITGAVDIENMYEFASSHCDDFKDLRDDEDIVINREWILNKLAEAEN